MKCRIPTSLRITCGAVLFAGCLFVSERTVLLQGGPLTTNAEAIIGRPATPVSYAGVARRTTRRSVAVVSAPVVVAPAAVVVAPSCVQSVDVYGRIYTRCH